MKRQFFLIAMLFLWAMAPLHAEEQTGTYRILGLCSTERQDDLRAAVKAVPDVQLVSLDFDKAEATLRYDTAKLVPDSKGKPPTPEAIVKRLNDLLSNASNNTFNVTALSTLPADKLTKLEIKVGLLDCKGCRYAAYCAIYKLDGVERATVSSKTSTITAVIDATKASLDSLTAALKKANVPLPEK